MNIYIYIHIYIYIYIYIYAYICDCSEVDPSDSTSAPEKESVATDDPCTTPICADGGGRDSLSAQMGLVERDLD